MRHVNVNVEVDERFLQTRFEDHRNYTSKMWMLGVLIVGGLWEWDWVVDPLHAPNTLWLRIVMVVGAVALVIFYRHATRKMAVVESAVTLVLFNALFYATLTRLSGGMVYGIGGFMFVQMAGLVVLSGFAFRHTVMIHVAAALTPHAIGLAFPQTGFQHAQYAALLWPATFMAVVAQYGRYCPFPATDGKPAQCVNGALTLGENIADLAGLTVAYDAYQIALGGRPAPTIDGFSGDQRFFLGWAQVWRRLYRDKELSNRLVTDVHSPSEFRAAVVRNLDAWYGAYDPKPGEALFLRPDERVKIW